jgi:hypothetical protein
MLQGRNAPPREISSRVNRQDGDGVLLEALLVVSSPISVDEAAAR